MFNWKIIVTVFITLGVLLAALSTNPAIDDFYQAAKERIFGVLEEKVTRNVTFTVSADSYTNLSFSGNMNFIITPVDFSADVKDGKIYTNKTIQIIGFTGSGSIDRDLLTLDGEFKKIEQEGTSISFAQGPIKASSTYSRIAAENLTLKHLTIPGGKLTLGGTEISFSSAAEIYYPQGDFEFDSGLKASGAASKIILPESGINIG